MTETVRAKELQEIERLDELNPIGGRFSDLVSNGLLRVEDFVSAQEQATFVGFAAALGDDGEAASLATAEVRAFAVATDDKAARRFATHTVPTVPLYYTTDLLENWASLRRPSPAEISEVLRSVETNGSYRPATSHPMRPWWDTNR